MTSDNASRPEPRDFLERVEFRDAALMSFVTSAVIVPAYDEAKREFGIIRAEYMLLLCLSHYPVLKAQDVSRLTGRPRNSISRTVHRMVKEGLIERAPDRVDRRKQVISITDQGRALIEDNLTTSIEIMESIKAKMGVQNYEALLDLLNQLDETDITY